MTGLLAYLLGMCWLFGHSWELHLDRRHWVCVCCGAVR